MAFFNGDILFKVHIMKLSNIPQSRKTRVLSVGHLSIFCLSHVFYPPTAPTVFVLEVQLIDRFSLSLPYWDLIHLPSNLLILKCVIQQFSVHSQSCVIISLMKFGIFLLPLHGTLYPLAVLSQSRLSLSPLSPDLSLLPFSPLSPQP